MTPEQRWASAIFLVILLGLLTAELVRDFEPAKLSAALVVVFWVPLLALHEAGHAVAAWLLGWHVGQVVIGMGQSVGKFRLGDAVVELRFFPVEGFVRCVPENLVLPRLKSACIYFAGPGIELALAGLVLGLIGADRMLMRSDDYMSLVWQSLALAATAQAVINLVPHYAFTVHEQMASDGMGIIRSFLLPTSHYQAMVGHRFNDANQEWEGPSGGDRWNGK